MGRTDGKSLKKQMKAHANSKPKKKKSPGDYAGNKKLVTSTGSTDLDLAISGGVVRGGGLFAGILVELFGPNSSGKTVLLLEIGGYLQRAGGDYLFNDPEARLDKGFAKQFDFKIDKEKVKEPDTVTEVFKNFTDWNPPNNGKVNGFIVDSLAALSTNLEMINKDGDKMGGRRGKEFSEGLRKSCRILKQKNHLMLCSNQIRDSFATHGEKFSTTGGKAVGFYATVRLRLFAPEKVKSAEKQIGKKKVTKVIGTKVKVEVYKNSSDVAYRTAYIYIMNGYGIDDIRANLQYIKDYTKEKQYTINGRKMGVSIIDASQKVEKGNLEDELKEQVIDLWEEIEAKFKIERKKKKR